MAEATQAPYGRKTQTRAGRQGGPRPLDHGRAELRRRHGLHHRRHAAQHRRHRHGGHPRPAQGPPAQSGAGLRSRRRLHELLVRGRRGPARRPFVLVVEGSIPNEKIKSEGYWAALGTDKHTGQPITTCEWIDRLAPKAVAVVAAGTCATYGGIHAMAGNPTGCMGLADYLGWDWRSKAGMPDRQRARLSGAAGQLHGDAALPALPGGGAGAHDPAGRAAAADLAVRQDRPRGLRPGRLLRAGRLRQRVRLAQVPRQARLLGAGGQLQRHQARLDGRHRRLSQRRRHLHRLHHARLPRQVHALHGRAARRHAVLDAHQHVRPGDPQPARPHQRHRQQGTEVAAPRPRTDHRLSSHDVWAAIRRYPG